MSTFQKMNVTTFEEHAAYHDISKTRKCSNEINMKNASLKGKENRVRDELNSKAQNK